MRNVIRALFLVFILLATKALAAPALPDQVTVTQSDGTKVAASIHGDEYQHWMESTDSGHTIVKNAATGDWEYAVSSADGSLKAANIKVAPNAQNAPYFIQTGLRPARDTGSEKLRQDALQRQLSQRIQQGGAMPSGSLSGGGITASGTVAGGARWVPTSVVGSRNLLVVRVNFSNRTLVTTPEQWGQAIFSTVPGDKSVANYYQDNSFGNLALAPVVHNQPGNPAGVVTVTVNLPHEANGTAETTWVQAALNQAAGYVDFAALDQNGDGIIDSTEALIYFIAAGYEQSGSSKTPSLWAHTYFAGSYIHAAGKDFAVWARSGELNNLNVQHPIGVVAHELGHQMVGFPDLYDTSSFNAGLGAYSLMSTGSWGADSGETQGTTPVALDAWSREFAGWTNPVVPSGTDVVTLDGTKSTSNTLKLTNPLMSTTEYYLVENRQPTGWDLGLTLFLGSGWSGGLLIEHVDNAMGTNRHGDSGHQGVVVAQANTSACNMLNSRYCYGNQKFFFYSGNNSSFNASTTPSSKFYNGTPMFRSLDNVSTAGSTMTALFSQGGAAPTGSIKINSGAPYAKSLAVNLTLTATVPSPVSVRDMSFSTDGSSWGAWETFRSSRSWTLDAGPDGARTVMVRYRDSAGNESVPYSASITLDTAPPTAIIAVNGTIADTVNATTVTFSVDGTDAVSYKSKLDAGTWSAETAAATTMSYKKLVSGSHTLSVIAKDAAGNWQAATSPSTLIWTVDTALPVTSAAPPGGNYTGPQSVVLSATKGATIYYSVNGTTPTTASAVYSTPIDISEKTTLKYFAVDSVGNTEAVKGQVYQFPPSATVSGVPALTKSSSATLTVGGSGVGSYRYQVDGGAVSAEIAIGKRIALSGLAPGVHSVDVFGKNSVGLWQQTPTTVTWTIDQTAPVSTASVADGVYPAVQTVALASDKPGKIYFTTNGSTPTTASSVYAVPLNIKGSTTVKYFAVDTVGNAERVNSAIYTITALSGAPAAVTKATTATLAVGGAGVVSYAYTVDGGDLSAETPVATKISLKALADGEHAVSVLGKRGDGTWQQSPTQVSWTVNHVPLVTSASPAGGSYPGTQSVTLSSSGAATIYYSTNGAAPSTASTRYSAPIKVATTTTLKFFSVDPAGNVEGVKTEIYTVQPTATVTGTPTLTNQTRATLAVSGAGVVSYVYQLDGSPTSATFPVSTKIVLTGLGAGTHTVSVTGKDKQGLWQDSPTSVSWTVQTAIPVSSASLPGGIYPPGQTVTLSSPEGSRVYYTTNGTTPTTASVRYVGPITVNASTTLKYFAADDAGNREGVKVASYTITNLFGAPAALGKVNSAGVTVGGSGVSTYVYTVDGGSLSSETPASRKITLTGLSDGAHTLAVYGKKGDGTWQQDPTQANWTVDATPAFTMATPAGGTYGAAQSVTLTSEEGAIIYYTTDGSVPSSKSPKYTDPITISASTTLRYLAVDAAKNQETVKTQIYALPPTATVSKISETMSLGAPLAFVVGGSNVKSFKYSLDGGAWSAEVPVTVQKTLSGIASGTHQLVVVGRDAAGVWQDAASPTAVVWNTQ